MREIKFRIWDNLKKEWVSNKQIWRMKTDEFGIGEIHPNTFYWKQHPDGLTYQQYTGLRDKNGHEIYEGDIMHYIFDGGTHSEEAQDRYLICVYDPDFGGFCFNDKDSSYYWAEIRRYVEITGNIFKNSELTK